ncbi:MAG TPA: hypothetical protein VK155_02585 [Bacteroidales bacterium]|nr:hypothetical protein [Bacteroidales bacterium]
MNIQPIYFRNWTAFILLLCLGCGITTDIFSQPKFIYADKGRLYFPDGREVALWGVNFQPNLSWEYNSRLKPIGIPLETGALRKNAVDGLDEIVKMKCNLIRCHLTPADFTDDKGNLLETIYLDMLDYMVAEAAKRGVYVYIALINHMNNGFVENSFMNKCKRADWIYDPNTITCSQNYIKQLLERKNVYTKVSYKDEPMIAVWEIINEPSYHQYEKIRESSDSAAYSEWLISGNIKDTLASYHNYRKKLVLDYINGMYDVIRGTGANQPVVWNCNWHKMYAGHEDVFEAAAESKAEVVSFCNYPGQNECKQPYYQNPEDFTKYDFTSFFKNSYEKKEWYGWALSPAFMKKAKVIYEFETFYNQSAYLYPVMADLYRSLGVQMAAMWTYCSPTYAQYSSGSHFLSLSCTPRKAAAFMVAGEIFRSQPLYKNYDVSSPVEKLSENYFYSYKSNLSAFISQEKYYYSGGICNLIGLSEAKNPKEVIGFGCSHLIDYEGTGLYFLNISDKDIRLSIEPDARWNTDPWLQSRYKSIVTVLDSSAMHSFELKIDGLDPKKCTVYRLGGKNRQRVSLKDSRLKFDAVAGEYLITKK